ncbi:hypothetical protein RHSIM_RhsimUnG0002700 [Rhododendron simsii]|uniref:Uncharacterized protein n=1 Tax=Rhododendron simsii TaxID=118357 RepID=A0A834L5U7_RHOSS|nr:hypothetical protein RHSIM_RhsimUnG0002700 [Rhododendron simsii]
MGKTSTILAVARKLYGTQMHNMDLELNALDKCGIDVVRQQIHDFASTQSFSFGFHTDFDLARPRKNNQELFAEDEESMTRMTDELLQSCEKEVLEEILLVAKEWERTPSDPRELE